MKNYYRIMLGPKSIFAEPCKQGNFIGVDFLEDIDLTNRLPENWRDFNKEFIPIHQKRNPERSKIGSGLACGFLWTVTKGLSIGDIVLCPNGQKAYMVGEVTSEYVFKKGEILPHRRNVRWFEKLIDRDQMSEALRNSCGSGTVSSITKYSEEIDHFIAGNQPVYIVSTDETIEDPSVFALEMHLEEFLVQNWKQTELGKIYDIYAEDGQLVGQQYPSDTGPIDILAISKDKKTLLVMELKKGRASDAVIGQIQRYMGYVKEFLAEKDQTVKGVIIALEKDIRLQRALTVTTNIEFYTYKISFKLEKG